MKNVRVRIAPSPTGRPHIGTLYMALFNFAFSKAHCGSFILRIEDTDQMRSRAIFEEDIFEALHWIGIQWDEGPDIGGNFAPYRQSERLDRYQKACFDLVRAKKAYKCFTTPKELEEIRLVQKKMGVKKSFGYDRRHRNLSDEEIQRMERERKPYVIRYKAPTTGCVAFHDEVKGNVTTPCVDIEDYILLKSDGFPTYHLANVVDDHDMRISHVIRGDEWLSSTAKHVLLYEAFEWIPPKFIHMPLLLGVDGKKLSKRRNPTSAFFYRDSGYLPEALCNFLTLMGYRMPNGSEIYSSEELISSFDIKHIGNSGAFFDLRKLDWMNQQYLIHFIKDETRLWQKIKEWSFNEKFMMQLMPLVKSRMKTFGDFMEMCAFFFINHLPYTQMLFCPKDISPEDSTLILQALIWALDERGMWGRTDLEQSARRVSHLFRLHFKQEMIPLLFATFMGKHQGPPLFDSFNILGESRSRHRLLCAIEFLGGISKKKMESLKEGWLGQDCHHLLTRSKCQNKK